MNIGLYWKFWKRAALLGGGQFIQNKNDFDTTLTKVVETNFAGGLEYKVAEGGTLTATVGKISSKKTGNETAANANFSAMQYDLFLTVAF